MCTLCIISIDNSYTYINHIHNSYHDTYIYIYIYIYIYNKFQIPIILPYLGQQHYLCILKL